MAKDVQRYETQEIESMPGLNGHEDWVKAPDHDRIVRQLTEEGDRLRRELQEARELYEANHG